MVISSNIKEIKLPNLSNSDINKLDQLFSFMKENEKQFVDIYKVCKKKWGDNKILYLFFAEYLKKNSFTLVETDNQGGEYVWKQMISPRGLALDSFRNEFRRQSKKKRKEETMQRAQSRVTGMRSIARSTFLITSLVVSFLFSAYLFKPERQVGTIKQQIPSEGNLSPGRKKL